mmetsp:Transcript_97124/g.212283  ORF Transcript_97124/g.212283 Transcript_97124/m.212283 type:complete len:271 (-) Transcript_97124:142-954(-)|eukprot:CAMPEP_0206523912 /NCGR_PEP_ID=MMETSP0324_2-20121206/67903_1 /ASSEMBLY_ACC=CAM_ASM_000836 /TAXON_ID=2866 /ORGANISM="Crypthecodinium cohnii, Strain Seligo" /LENGTH=270 /DNA_ID=CAMNT_0054018443 /DNA_START=95 /DNA_END=907 /DNA_ORIENTATION=+
MAVVESVVGSIFCEEEESSPCHLAPQSCFEAEEPILSFGPDLRSNTDIIRDLLTKLPAKSLPPMTGLHNIRPPPGLEKPAAMGWPAGCAWYDTPSHDDNTSTVDETSSEHSSHRSTDIEVETITTNKNIAFDRHAQHERTTLMVRNIPVMCSQETLLREWESTRKFNFLYLPRTAGGVTNLSYAFVNFDSEEDAVAFRAAWHKRHLAESTTRKPLNVSFAEVQGLEANLSQLRRKRAKEVEKRLCQPVVRQGGQYMPLTQALPHFWAPTK